MKTLMCAKRKFNLRADCNYLCFRLSYCAPLAFVFNQPAIYLTLLHVCSQMLYPSRVHQRRHGKHRKQEQLQSLSLMTKDQPLFCSGQPWGEWQHILIRKHHYSNSNGNLSLQENSLPNWHMLRLPSFRKSILSQANWFEVIGLPGSEHQCYYLANFYRLWPGFPKWNAKFKCTSIKSSWYNYKFSLPRASPRALQINFALPNLQKRVENTSPMALQMRFAIW
jgi:hypothetical protein